MSNSQHSPRYITAAEVEGGVIPAGGAVDQVLAKESSTDYDLKWANPGGGSGLSKWDSVTEYSAGTIVLDRNGIWKATGTNDDSRPFPGNDDWELVGGVPYVDVEVNNDDILAWANDPFPSATNPIAIIPPTETLKQGLLPTEIFLPVLVTALVDTRNGAYDQRITAGFCIGANGFSGLSMQINLATDDGAIIALVFNFALLVNTGVTTAGAPRIDGLDGLPDNGLYLENENSELGMTGGNAANKISLRVHYQRVPLPANAAKYFQIYQLDQGTKTFTVTNDASALTGSISVVASTGNNGTYTIVSATFDTDHTDIVVSEAIPDSTADGWVKQ